MIDNSKQKATRGTSGILSEADAGTAFSSVIDTVLGKIWQVVENEEYVEVVTDADGTFLRGIKSDGSVEWAKGVPTPIREICPSERIDNPEWLFLWCRGLGRRAVSVDGHQERLYILVCEKFHGVRPD